MSVPACPHCGSADVVFSRKRQVYVCADCEHVFEAGRVASVRRVFLSYGRDPYAHVAARVARDLRARGHEVWFDADNLSAGGDWEEDIDRGLDWAGGGNGRLVLLMTPHAVRRPDGYCLNELARALARGIAVVPVMLVWCEPPLSICRLQWLDLRECLPLEDREARYTERFEHLVAALETDKLEFEGTQSKLLQALQPLPFDADIAQHVARFAGRRQATEGIDAWLTDPAGSRIRWVTSGPGGGKTALSAWLWRNRREVAAFHLCRHGDAQKADPRWVVRSVAFQLASQLPDLQRRLGALDLDRLIVECNAQTLFDRLVVQPLHAGFERPDHTLLVVVDGLDEAGVAGTNDLASFVATEFIRAPAWLRFLVTSRPDADVAHALQGITQFPLDGPGGETHSDLRAYITREFTAFAPGGVLSDPVIESILARCEGVFLYAVRVRDELADGRLSLDRIDDFPRGLGGSYAQFFKRQFPDLTAFAREVRPALEVIIAARSPRTLRDLGDLIGWDEYALQGFHRALGSLFSVTAEGVRAFHATVLNWLTDAARAGPYYVSATRGHEVLAIRGLSELRARGAVGLSDYSLHYLADHLVALQRFTDLADMLGRHDVVAALWELDRYRLRLAWRRLEADAAPLAADLRRTWTEHLPDDARLTDAMADLMNSMGHWTEALALYDHAIACATAAGDVHRAANTLHDKAYLLRARGDAKGALAALDVAVPLCRELEDLGELRRGLTLRAELLTSQGDHNEALGLLHDVEGMSREAGDPEALTASLQSRAWILCSTRGDHEAALGLLAECERLSRERGALDALARTLSLAGMVERERGDLAAGANRFSEMESLCRTYGMIHALVICRNLQGELARRAHDWPTADTAYAEAESLAGRLGSALMAAVAQGNRSAVLAESGQPDNALALLTRSLTVVRAVGSPFIVVQGLLQQAELLDGSLARRAEAIAVADDALALATQHGYRALESRCRDLLTRLHPKDDA